MKNNIAKYPNKKTIAEIFEENVKKTPNNIAVRYENNEITYEELNKKANKIARKLRRIGVKPNDFVAIVAERSIEMIIGIYAIVKSGATYIPIDTIYPKDRIKFMLEDCKPKAILTYNTEVETDLEIIDLNDSGIYEENDENLEIVNKSEDNLYLIYTSGTTGKPKGVMVTNKNLVSLLKNERFQYDFNEKDVWVMFHSYCFDFSVWEMYGATLNGGTLLVISKDIAKDSYAFAEAIEKNKVTVLNQVPSAFYNLMQADNSKFSSVRYLIFGGEKLNPKKLKQWREVNKQTTIVNMYGITETTIHATYKEIGEKEIEKGISDIGQAIPNLNVFILNGLSLCEPGIEGEICVSGEGVAKGYLNREELTKERFIDNPFGEGKLYRSGDLGRYLEDGNIEYLGRIDDQVKIRGFRIELGEIDSSIRKIDDVKDVVVITRENNSGESEINAYIISENQLIINRIREELKEYLPEYMIPAKMMVVDSFELTVNGKLDKEALPEIKEASSNVYVEPATPLEEEVVDLWKDMLDIDMLGVEDNFLEIGGHSLIATKMVYRINETYDIELSLVEFLTNGLTVRTLSEIIEEKLFNSISEDELAIMLEEIED